jgi:predicted nucleic acid-binding protein
MALDGPTFFDTSVLVAGLIEMGDSPSAADRILDGIKRHRVKRPATSWHCCLEFFSVATRLPAGVRLEPVMARTLLEEEIMKRFEIADLPPSARASFLASAANERVAGGRIYDAHIAETARLAGARTVVTDNRRHFVALLRYGIRVLTAAEYADEASL